MVATPREVAVAFTDREHSSVSEASVYRLLRAEGLITSPAFIVMKAAEPVRQPHHRGQPALADRLRLPQGHRLGLVLPIDHPRASAIQTSLCMKGSSAINDTIHPTFPGDYPQTIGTTAKANRPRFG
jgi:hypothetical protein